MSTSYSTGRQRRTRRDRRDGEPTRDRTARRDLRGPGHLVARARVSTGQVTLSATRAAGTSSKGGAIALVGDDPGGKSSAIRRRPTPRSTTSTYALLSGRRAGGRRLGRHAVALSRMTGLWTSMKIVSPVSAVARSISASIGSRSSPPISRSPATQTARSTSRDPGRPSLERRART